MNAPGISAAGSAVTIGAFDGVHLGHRRLVGMVRKAADDLGLRCVVVTFDRHPASVVRPSSAPALLTDLEQRTELLREAGAGEVHVLRFDEERAAEPAEAFVREVLAGDLAARVVIVGSDFHFGSGRKGNVALLRTMGADLGFSVVGYGLVDDEGEHEVISSTRIRSLLAAGDVEGAAALLGRDHEVRGVIATGAEGHDALALPREIALPAPGEYETALERTHLGEVVRTVAVVPPPASGEELAHVAILRPPVAATDGHAAPLVHGEPARLRFHAPVGRPAAAPARHSGP